MAVPRVFISSTFYDLRQIRDDLERVIRELGYEAVRNETGAIPYGKDQPPEDYAYRELAVCDIFVSVVGGRFGTESRDGKGYSISQNELRTALERGIPVFIFVDKSVWTEFETFRINKGNDSINYRFVDDVRVFEFLDFVTSLPNNNPISEFSTAADITSYLKKQWAGLFQRFLRDQQRIVEIDVLKEMKSVAGTMQQLVKYLADERNGADDAIKGILLANHPAFARFAALTETPYRVFFSNVDELNVWLNNRSFQATGVDAFDDVVRAWFNQKSHKRIVLKEDIFDADGRLRIFDASNWQDSWVELTETVDDDVPF